MKLSKTPIITPKYTYLQIPLDVSIPIAEKANEKNVAE
jgi:hypothetical protein